MCGTYLNFTYISVPKITKTNKIVRKVCINYWWFINYLVGKNHREGAFIREGTFIGVK